MDKKDTSSIADQDIIEMSETILNEAIKVRVSTTSTPTITTKSFTPDEIRQMKLTADLVDKKHYYEPSSWIDIFNELNKIGFIYKTDSVTRGGSRLDMNTYKAFVRTRIKELGLSKHFSKQAVDDIILLWTDREKRQFLCDIRSNFAYSQSKIDHIATWVHAATGTNNKLDIAVMKHFVWQIRRKLYGLEAQHHMMPILYGKSGGGKSQAVLKLLKPMDEVVLNMDLSIFSDQFKTRLFTKAYIMFFDEMAKSERADIDRLKNIITSPVVDFRGMHTENLESAPQNCTFIGCSNDAVYDKIYDPTSARRYWQINCADKLAWKSINSIDYLALWKSVDENKESPIIPYLSELKDIQERTIRNKDLVEEWLTTECDVTAYDAGKNPTSQQLYHHFSDWCKIQKINNQPTAARFYRRLEAVVKHINLPIGPHRTKRGTVWAVATGSVTATLKLSTVEEQKRLVEEIELQQSLKARVDNLAASIKKIQG